jgi:hypothetical protein
VKIDGNGDLDEGNMHGSTDKEKERSRYERYEGRNLSLRNAKE